MLEVKKNQEENVKDTKGRLTMAPTYSRRCVCLEGKAGEEATAACWCMPTGKHVTAACFPPPDTAVVIAR